MGEAPQDYIAQMVAGVVGIEVEIVRLEGKHKLSQNKNDRDRDGAAQGLEQRGQAALAAAVRSTIAK